MMKWYPQSFFSVPSSSWILLILASKVTLEIETNPPKVQVSGKKAGTGRNQTSKDSTEKQKAEAAEAFQIPAELVD